LAIIFIVPQGMWKFMASITVAAGMAAGVLVLVGEGDFKKTMKIISIIIMCLMGVALIIAWGVWFHRHYPPKGNDSPIEMSASALVAATTATSSSASTATTVSASLETTLPAEYRHELPSQINLFAGSIASGYLLAGQSVELIFHDDPSQLVMTSLNGKKTNLFYEDQGIRCVVTKILPKRNPGEKIMVTNVSDRTIGVSFKSN
jgi:lysylphosphatidylglycerol synthetase-like protein (DUF2156 family)